jgi:hypothetical protein
VLFGVRLGSLAGVMGRVETMPMGDVCMVAGLFVVAGFLVFGGRAVVNRGLLVVVGGVLVMLGSFVG